MKTTNTDLKPSGKGTFFKKSFAWLFGLMFFTWLLFSMTVDVTLYKPTGLLAVSVATLLLCFANSALVFYMSIHSLTTYREKGLAITALVFSSIIALACMGWLRHMF